MVFRSPNTITSNCARLPHSNSTTGLESLISEFSDVFSEELARCPTWD